MGKGGIRMVHHNRSLRLMVLVVFFRLGEGNLARVRVGKLAGRLRWFHGVFHCIQTTDTILL